MKSTEPDKKHPGGRPLKFKTAKELEEQIEAYFDSCWRDLFVRDKKGQVILDPESGQPLTERVQVKPYTITGLALFLGTSRQTLLEYQGEVEGRVKKDPKYADAITRAKLRCENHAEESLWTPKIGAGVIFNLKNNYNWKDKQQVEWTPPEGDLDDYR